MVHTAFSCNLQSRWAVPASKTGEGPVQHAAEKLSAIAGQLLKAEGKHVQLEFIVRTSEGRFHMKSFPGEAAEDVCARIAYVALMPDHGGLEAASVRAVRDISAFSTSGKCGGTQCSSWSCASTAASGSTDESTSNTDTDSGSCYDSNAISFRQTERKLGVRFSDVAEEIFFTTEHKTEETLPEGKPVKSGHTIDSVLSNISLFF